MSLKGTFAAATIAILIAFGTAFAQSAASTKSASTTPVKKTLVGKATYYGGKGLDGNETANGETFDHREHTAAAPKTIPLGSTAKVTNLKTGKSVTVRITDRGPRVRGRHIDLSRGAAQEIGITRKEGKAPVKVEVTKLPPAED
ncbi:MAG TPA: septal ring lytic transglycosylase RlpA family protein [Candidatus Binataceae bacterium]|nr:septal ring lytic transglycosylase RlpA family protein [Candidatus Binataceae bacterium]